MLMASKDVLSLSRQGLAIIRKKCIFAFNVIGEYIYNVFIFKDSSYIGHAAGLAFVSFYVLNRAFA